VARARRPPGAIVFWTVHGGSATMVRYRVMSAAPVTTLA
jgi:hypothetical protein